MFCFTWYFYLTKWPYMLWLLKFFFLLSIFGFQEFLSYRILSVFSWFCFIRFIDSLYSFHISLGNYYLCEWIELIFFWFDSFFFLWILLFFGHFENPEKYLLTTVSFIVDRMKKKWIRIYTKSPASYSMYHHPIILFVFFFHFGCLFREFPHWTHRCPFHFFRFPMECIWSNNSTLFFAHPLLLCMWFLVIFDIDIPKTKERKDTHYI